MTKNQLLFYLVFFLKIQDIRKSKTPTFERGQRNNFLGQVLTIFQTGPNTYSCEVCNYFWSKQDVRNNTRLPFLGLQYLNLSQTSFSAQKMKFSIQDFFSKCDQIRGFLRIWSHLLKKLLLENFILCAVLGSNELEV